MSLRVLSPGLKIPKWEERENNVKKSDIRELSLRLYFDLYVVFFMF